MAKYVYSNYTDNVECVKEFLDGKSDNLCMYIEKHPESHFQLWYKNIKHSDVVSSGKRTETAQPYSKNILNYLTVEEMSHIDQSGKKPFPTAHQSSIHIPIELSRTLGIEEEKGIRINNNARCYLANDSLEYFTYNYTKKVVDKLGKSTEKLLYRKKYLSIEKELNLTKDFTEVDITMSAHGLGEREDLLFHKLRHYVFAYDTIILLLETNTKEDKPNLFIAFDRNPKFYDLAEVDTKLCSEYLELIRRYEDNIISSKEEIKAVFKSRKYQNKWKSLLASEMKTYSDDGKTISCPISKVHATFEDVPMVFIASHIKSYETCTVKEAFDKDNGLLLLSSVDSLFDKHMFTISQEKKIIVCEQLRRNKKLMEHLQLQSSINDNILNPRRMKYLAEHEKVFNEKREKRNERTFIDSEFYMYSNCIQPDEE